MFDAIVIGSGHNGLAAAAGLAAKGWKVGVFEAADSPGGAVRSAELTIPGFKHDLAAMNLSLFAGSAFHAENAETLASHGLAFVPARDCFATAWPDGRWLGVSTDVNITAARIGGFSQKDATAWRAMLTEFGETAGPILAVLGSRMTPLSLARTLFSIWRKHGSKRLFSLARLLLQSPRAFLDENFESPHLKAMMAAWGMHLDFAPDQAGGAMFPYLESMANQAFGLVIGRGGAQTMTGALCAMLTENGGELHCGARVAKINTANGTATGITLEDGRQFTASRAVIANVHPKALLANGFTPDKNHSSLLDQPTDTPSFDRAVSKFISAPGTMMLHLALSDLPNWRAAELRRFAYVHLAPSLDMMSLAYQQAKAGLLPSEPVLVIGQPTTIDPSRAPAGQHTLWVQVRMVPAVIKGDGLTSGKIIAARDWANAKEPMAERILDIIERYAPDLRARILGSTIVSPLDLQAGNANLVGGDQISGSHHLAQNFLFRPAAGFADGSTPIKKLHLVGASVWPGAGVGAGSGYQLLKQLAK
jgi:phytoene dehydrogenase-like protein